MQLKTPAQIVKMRAAGLVVQRALAAVADAAAPGVSTRELDGVAADVLRSAGAGSSFLGYGAGWGLPPYPGVTCISVNDEIVHGLPGDRVLADGDIVSVDFGAIVDGWHGDSAVTLLIGDVSPEARALSEVTRASMWAGIGAARLGGRLNDIGKAIERSIEAAGDYGIVEEYTGHGIGTEMHQEPDVLNYSVRGRTPKIVEGLVIAIEPMVTLGPDAQTRTLDDEWTVVTADGSLAAHWEHTMTVTKNGVWVLTAEDGGEAELARLGVPFGPLAD